MKRTEDKAKPYQTFEDLEVYQVAREFRRRVSRGETAATGRKV
jgi:hypothetical protein